MATSSPRGLDSSATKGAPLFMAHGASAVHPRKIFVMVCLQGGSRWCPLSYKLVYKPYLLELQMHQHSDSDLGHQQGREDRVATQRGRGRFFRRDLKTTIFGQNRGGLWGATHLYLVGGLEHDFYFSIYWEFHNPNWLSYFSEGLKPPTSYISHIYTNFKRKEVFKTENVCQSKDHVGIHWLLSKISLDMHRAMSKPPRSQAAEVWFSYHGHKLLTRGCWRQVSPRRLGVLSLDSGLPPGCHLPWLDDENKP